MKKGDIVININTSEGNPYHRLLYIHKEGHYYAVLAFNGKILHIHDTNIRGEDSLKYVGHMKEYDSFVKALAALGTEDEDE